MHFAAHRRNCRANCKLFPVVAAMPERRQDSFVALLLKLLAPDTEHATVGRMSVGVIVNERVPAVGSGLGLLAVGGGKGWR